MRFPSSLCCIKCNIELHKGPGHTRLSFHLWKIIFWLWFLRERKCFQMNWRPPCSFHGPQKPSAHLWGNQRQSQSHCTLEGFVILTPMFSLSFVHTKLLPAAPTGLYCLLWISAGPFGCGRGTFQQNTNDVWPFSTLWFRAFIIWGKKIKHLTEWNSANGPECDFYDYKFNQPF